LLRKGCLWHHEQVCAMQHSCSNHSIKRSHSLRTVYFTVLMLIGIAITGWADSSNWNRRKAYTEQNNLACQVSAITTLHALTILLAKQHVLRLHSWCVLLRTVYIMLAVLSSLVVTTPSANCCQHVIYCNATVANTCTFHCMHVLYHGC
jgi:hypothetical protein